MKSRALFIGSVWPEPESSAAGVRTLGLIRTLIQDGWEIYFLSPSIEKPFTTALQDLGVHTRSQQANDPSFDSFVAELQPEAVIYDRFFMEEQFGWRVREHSPDSLNILDTIDLHSLRRGRQQGVDAPSHEDALREVASIYRCDLALMISDFEMTLLIQKLGVPENLLLHLPFFYAPARQDLAPEFDARADFVSIGNFRHPPNADGTRWLKERIWPLIRAELPHAEAHIYGAYPSKEIMDLTDRQQGFFVKGPAVEAIETLRQYRVNLAPLRFGAGIKGKIADGWSAGTPTVTTPVGAEGMRFKSGEFAGPVTESEAEFASHCVRVYRDTEAWLGYQARGFTALQELFGVEKNSTRFLNAISSLRAKLAEHRAGNFTGAMLRHHFHQSTKYLSKWIEAKNR